MRLIFTCCHPALAPEAQVALTLRTVCGLTTEEIARAFLVPTPTLAQRLVRAKAKIKGARIRYEVPGDDELAERLDSVLAVVYLVFNEGYAASFGAELVRAELCVEAIRLGRLLVELLPAEHEPKGLLALMLLHDARRATRTDDDGAIVLLEEQDRSRWDRMKIAEGTARRAGLAWPPAGVYAVQAAIAALHAQASSARETDWPQIAALHGVLVASTARRWSSSIARWRSPWPMASSMASPAGHHPSARLSPAAGRARGPVRRLGRRAEAAAAYRQALARVTNAAERRFLEWRLPEVTRPAP